MIRNAIILGLLLLSTRTIAQVFQVGRTYFGPKDYVEYQPGNLPLIISVPHDGELAPSDIPDRNCAGCVTVTDLNTQDLGRRLREAVFQKTGCYPHLIINRLRRTKLDANRDIQEAANGNAEAEAAWNAFHALTDTAKAILNREFGKGLYIDLHGHGHSIQRLELGYLLSGSQLRQSDASLNTENLINQSSIRQLVLDNAAKRTHAELVRGESSLGGLMEKALYPSVPGTFDPSPRSSDAYFSGGYNTERHGSLLGGKIDAIQIECNFSGVRDSDASREFFAKELAGALLEFLELHYFGKKGGQCQVTSLEEPLIPTLEVFPNPGCGAFQISRGEIAPDASLKITDVLGRIQVTKPAGNTFQLPPDQFPDGIYRLSLVQSRRVIAQQTIVQQCH